MLKNAANITLLIFHFFRAKKYPVIDPMSMFTATDATVIAAVFLRADQKFIR